MGHVADALRKCVVPLGQLPHEAFGASATLVRLKAKQPPLLRPLAPLGPEWRPLGPAQRALLHALWVAGPLWPVGRVVEQGAVWRDEVPVPLEEPLPAGVGRLVARA